MAWTYVLPIATAKDEVRFHCGDTDSSRPLLQDEEIEYVLTKEPDIIAAAAVACDSIASKLSQRTDASVDGVSSSRSQAAQAFSARAAELRKRAGILAPPVFGGVYKTQHDALDQDTSLVQPSFKIGQDDHPGLPDERYTSYSREDWWH